MKTKTHYFGHDCLGNTPHAVTVEGVCIADIYRDAAERFYNQSTGERGAVARGGDGELHFTPAVAVARNPAHIPDSIRDRGEALMDLAAALQDSARQITRMLGRAETIYRRSAPAFGHGEHRDRVAAEVRACRRWLRAQGYDAARVCAEFRDPGAFAFCDGGGATPADLRADSVSL